MELSIYMKKLCEAKIEKIKKESIGKKIYIWGCFSGGTDVGEVLEENNIYIHGYIDRKASIIPEFRGYPVYHKERLNVNSDYIIVAYIGFNQEILDFLFENGFDKSMCWVFEHDFFQKEDFVYRDCKIGRYTYGYKDLLKESCLASSIGRYCSINKTARIWGNHAIECVTTSPILDMPWLYDVEKYGTRKKYLEKYGKYKDFSDREFQSSSIRKNELVEIGNDVWIGANVVILQGVKIGDGAVVAADSVVTKNVEPYSIVGGVPAKIIRYRFSKGTIERLLQIKWWDCSVEEIEKNIELFYQTEKFVNMF